jgi:hypothetical protein
LIGVVLHRETASEKQGVKEFDPDTYGSAFAELLSEATLMPLDEGRPNQAVRSQLNDLSLDKAFARSRVADANMANCGLAGVWLLHNFLDESHTISQGIATPSGSFWHGIMHRRERDFSNAKYWFDRVGDHPVFSELTTTDGSAWDVHRFVDECQRALRSRDTEQIAALRQSQQREWQALFDFCYRAAISE